MLAIILVSSQPDKINTKIAEILSHHNLKKVHPDLIYFEVGDKLGIEAAKKIKQHLSLKPLKSNYKAVVIEAAWNLTLEAQNALLKSLEEPTGEALIILGVDSEDKLLPTIVSRCQVIHLGQQTTGTAGRFDDQIKWLLGLDTTERFVFVEKLENREGFLQALTTYFQQPKTLASHLSSGNTDLEFLKDLLQAQIWANQNVNIRAILEYLMLKMPLVKQ